MSQPAYAFASYVQPKEDPFESFLRQHEDKDLLRFSTAGSVDDGKSTLIGRLLFDSKGVYEDQIAAVRKLHSIQTAGGLDLALLTDGLRAEREQGITIDVAYRYFSTPKRKFIIADTPGHEQYTRNMATGASTSNLAIVLVDARHGVLVQSRRHAFVASLLGIRHLVVAINKMDLVNYSEEVFGRIQADFSAFAAQLPVPDLHFIPISALHGDNVVERSRNMPWFHGESLLQYLETVHIASDRNLTEMRFPVQNVIRPDQNFRGYAGQLASGIMKPGDPVMVLPSRRMSRIKSIVTFDGHLSKAFPPMSVTVCLEDEIDISRGDMLVQPSHVPNEVRKFDARVVWMSSTPLDARREYRLKVTSLEVKARVRELRYRINVNSLEKEPVATLQLNDIGSAVIETHRHIFVDPYRRNRATGSFILIDPVSNETVAAGMITGRLLNDVGTPLEERAMPAEDRVTGAERSMLAGHLPAVIWLTNGDDFAYRLERTLFNRGCLVQALSASASGRLLPHLAASSVSAGLLAICSAGGSSYAARNKTRALVGSDRFLEVAPGAGNAEEQIDRICGELEHKGFLRSKR